MSWFTFSPVVRIPSLVVVNSAKLQTRHWSLSIDAHASPAALNSVLSRFVSRLVEPAPEPCANVSINHQLVPVKLSQSTHPPSTLQRTQG